MVDFYRWNWAFPSVTHRREYSVSNTLLKLTVRARSDTRTIVVSRFTWLTLTRSSEHWHDLNSKLQTRTNNTDTIPWRCSLHNTTLMAYVQVEADDVRIYAILLVLLKRLTLVSQQRLEEGPEALQFKCASRCVHQILFDWWCFFWTAFLGADSEAANGPTRSTGIGNTDRRECHFRSNACVP